MFPGPKVVSAFLLSCFLVFGVKAIFESNASRSLQVVADAKAGYISDLAESPNKIEKHSVNEQNLLQSEGGPAAEPMMLSQDQLQKLTQRWLPFQQDIPLGQFSFDQAEITLGQENRGFLKGLFSFTLNSGARYSGELGFDSGVLYRAVEGAFYLHQPKIRFINIQGVSQDWSGIARDIVQDVLSYISFNTPVYQLNRQNPQENFVYTALYSVEVANHALIVRFKNLSADATEDDIFY